MITDEFDIYGHSWGSFFEKMDKNRKIMNCRQNEEIIVEVGENMCLTVQNISVI
ncbi:MAG: hypothetical protein H8E10_20195 [Desulfobacterales bacterium]|nr:hypothetical protein [Desulfobacterales bacterium]MBL7101394.1 hypothetical protein [Desulfobacteraceae bacterium]MBL7173110.1 hypothetical protein [Desulfobacteraceae bacterium]